MEAHELLSLLIEVSLNNFGVPVHHKKLSFDQLLSYKMGVYNLDIQRYLKVLVPSRIITQYH